MKNFKHLSLAMAGLLCSVSTVAEVNHIELSAAVWGTTMDGGFDVEAIDYRVNTDEFDFSTEASGFFSIRVEGENKYAPDLLIGLTSVTHSGPGLIDLSGNEIEVGEGAIDLSHVELILYYSIFQNDVVDLNLGLAGKFFYGDFSLNNIQGNTDAESSLETQLPMFYASIDYQPIKSLNTYFTLQGGSYDGTSGHDASLGIDYIFENKVGLGLGYRQFETVQSSELKQYPGSDFELDLKVNGGFLRIFYQQ